MHYDFHRGQGPRHPFFHVQIGPVNFDAEQLKLLRVDQASVTPAGDTLHGVRIPTPLIGLSGLLLSLAADYWDEARFAGFLATLKTSKVLQLPADCMDLRSSLMESDNSMHSYHWYGYAA
jgi:hypothetical protein